MRNDSEPNDSRTFAIIGAAMEVHRVLGSGFLEVFYRDALAIEFGLRTITSFKPRCLAKWSTRLTRSEVTIESILSVSVRLSWKSKHVSASVPQNTPNC